VLFLLAALLLPDSGSETARDLRANYFARSRWFFGLGVLLLVASLTRDVVLTGSLPGRLNTTGHVFALDGLGHRSAHAARVVSSMAGFVLRADSDWLHRGPVPALP